MSSSLGRFLRQYHKKILAISFITLGMLLFLGFYVSAEILTDWTYFRNSPMELWNFFIFLICYGILLWTNINNDNYAYRGIYMFLILIVFEGVWGAVNIFRNLSAVLASGDPLYVVTSSLYLVFYGGLIGVGIALYITTFRYMTGRRLSFTLIRVLYLVYDGLLIGAISVEITIFALSGGLNSPLLILTALSIPLSEALVAVGVGFTYERLRRI